MTAKEAKMLAKVLLGSFKVNDLASILQKFDLKDFTLPGTNSQMPIPSGGNTGNGGSIDPALLKSYQSSPVKDMFYNALNVAGTGFNTAGNIYGTKNDLLAKALLAAAQQAVPAQQAQIYGNPLSAMMQLPALALMARGKAQQYLGEGINKMTSDVARDLRDTERYNKAIKMQLEQSPNNAYWNAQIQQQKLGGKP